MTGWPPGLLQDDDRGLSRWLANRPGARRLVRIRCDEIRNTEMTLDKERLRVLAEAATPGPWILLPIEEGSPYLRIRGTRLGTRYKVANVLAPTYFMPRDGIESTANAEFIAAAREAIPALLSENAALAAEVERLRKDAGHAEPMTRFCPGCGSVGEVPKKYRDCCPDGGDSRVIPTNLANKCHDLFQGALQAAMADKGAPT